MEIIRGSDLLALGESLAELKRFSERLDPERINRAVRDACNAADVHLTCDYPECKCKQMPAAVRAGIASWEKRGQ